MTRWIHGMTMLMGMAAVACGGGSQATSAAGNDTTAAQETKAAEDPSTRFGPLGVGADWQSYTKINTEPVRSQDHGGNFVDTYVNDIGLAAYQDPDEVAEIPVGTIVVKTSLLRDGDAPGDTAGPIFVMEKRAPGFDADNGDWYYAIHWADPPEPMRKRFGGPFYWQSPSAKVDYCVNCHAGYDRQLGMVPEEFRKQ